MGVIIDEIEAKESPCRCYKLNGNGQTLCFSDGVVGVLSDEQEDEYCTVKNVIDDDSGLKQKLQVYTEAINEAKTEFFEEADREFEGFIKKIDKKFKQRGINI